MFAMNTFLEQLPGSCIASARAKVGKKTMKKSGFTHFFIFIFWQQLEAKKKQSTGCLPYDWD
ncbi:MAG: hypothetical protein ACOCXV_01575 [Bacteroidota bacterium]